MCVVFWGFVGFLSNVPADAMEYTIAIWIFLGMVYTAVDCYRYAGHYRELSLLREEIMVSTANLPETKEPVEQLYQEMLIKNLEDKKNCIAKMEHEKKDMEEYYGMWVHQIKTPIAGMSLLLQASDFDEKETMQLELFRVEQYVDMVLSYIRLSDDSNDFVLKEYEVDRLVRQTVKKFANQFIYRKISLCMEGVEGKILTDAKWFGFVLEQLLSNALKYTDKGSITISCHDNKIQITDTGIGIAKEDLPRIFERGYTGYNGRLQKKSTGIGLYLCKCTMEKLSGKITVQSEVGEGTSFTLSFPKAKKGYE